MTDDVRHLIAEAVAEWSEAEAVGVRVWSAKPNRYSAYAVKPRRDVEREDRPTARILRVDIQTGQVEHYRDIWQRDERGVGA